MKVFIAVTLTSEVREQLGIISRKVEAHSEKGSFYPDEIYHITVKFIGKVNEPIAEELKSIIDIVAKMVKPFYVEIDKIGYFRRKGGIIVWAGTEKIPEELKVINEELENMCKVLGYPKEKRSYEPHITLGRRVVLDSTFEELEETIGDFSAKGLVTKILLLESTRVDDELKYIPIHSADLV